MEDKELHEPSISNRSPGRSSVEDAAQETGESRLAGRAGPREADDQSAVCWLMVGHLSESGLG